MSLAQASAEATPGAATAEHNLGFMAMALGTLGIAFAPVLAKLAVNLDGAAGGAILSPVAVGFWRMALATPVFAYLARRSGLSQRRVAAGSWRLWRPLLLIPAGFITGDLAAWHWAFEFTSVANATLLVNFAVVIVAGISWWWFKDRFTFWFPLGAVTALLGMALLVGFSFATSGQAWIGDLLGLGAAFAYAGYQVSSKVALGLYSVERVMAWTTGGGAVLLGIVAALSPGRFFPQTAASWAALIGLAVVSQLIGQGLINFGLRRLPVGLASVVLVLQPVFAAGLGWLILSQALSPAQLGAGALTVLGIYLARRGSQPRPA